ncbi:uncharacterized protein LOC131858067 [Cryptomeria japonica]|uniref:uncharacterized protein LOC131858067 n=1 Tax=Cryptomeria japonica TaxID=3369 RepID=UPI0027DA7FB1|nr:uncharacterized protein LOC131858067 [Cryptomeria japonica]
MGFRDVCMDGEGSDRGLELWDDWRVVRHDMFMTHLLIGKSVIVIERFVVSRVMRQYDAGVLPQYKDWFQSHPFPRFTDPVEHAPLIEEVEDEAPVEAQGGGEEGRVAPRQVRQRRDEQGGDGGEEPVREQRQLMQHENPVEGGSSGGKYPDSPLDSGDPGEGPRPREEQIAGGSGNEQVQISNLGGGIPKAALGQQTSPHFNRIEEEIIKELGNELKKEDNKKIDHQEKEQNNKDSDHGEIKSQFSSQNEETKEDKTEQNSDNDENNGDNQSKVNKEEGENFNLVSNLTELEKEIDWIQDAQPDNILDQGLSEISLASPAKVKMTFLEDKEPKWGDEEDVKKALGKSESKQEEEETMEDKRKIKQKKRITTVDGIHRNQRRRLEAERRKFRDIEGKMGGHKKRFEPTSYSDWRKNREVWDILQEGGLSVFMERLSGKDPAVTKHFIKNWKNGKILVGSHMMIVDEEIIAEATMITEGMKFYRDRSIFDKAADKFHVTDDERKKMVKVDSSYHSPKQICRPWRFVLFATITYITLDGRFTRAYGHHFVLLNYFRHGEKSIEKPIKGKYERDEDTESEASGFNFDSETEGDSEETSKKGMNKAKRKRIMVDSDISESEAESFEEKFIKRKKGKVTGKQTQRKKTNKESNKDISQILIDSEEEAEENKKDERQDKDGEENQVTDNIEGLNAQGMQKEEQEDKSGKISDCVGENETIKGFCETVGTMVKDIGSLKKDMLTVKRAMVGEKPLAENVKELAVAINNMEVIERMVGKIIATEKRDEDTESEASGFNFDSEIEGDSEETSKKGRNKAKRKRIVVVLDISESEAESFEGKFIKKKKGKVTGKQMQSKKTSKGSNKDISQIMLDSDEEAEENKNYEGQDKEGEENPVMGNTEGLNTQGMQKQDQEDKSGKLSDCVGENATIKGFGETVDTMVKDSDNLKKDMMVVKRETIGEKPQSKNVKELAVVINNAEAIESMAGKIIATKKKVKETEENKEVKGMETPMNNLDAGGNWEPGGIIGPLADSGGNLPFRA